MGLAALFERVCNAAQRESRVFLVATANDVSALTPELLHKRRFEEIFFVGLPDASTREAIFRIHRARRALKPRAIRPGCIGDCRCRISGAGIEQAVVSLLYEARAARAEVDTAMLLAELARTRTLSIVMAERVQALHDWARERTVTGD